MEEDRPKDGAAARGIAVGILYGAILWALVALALALFLGSG